MRFAHFSPKATDCVLNAPSLGAMLPANAVGVTCVQGMWMWGHNTHSSSVLWLRVVFHVQFTRAFIKQIPHRYWTWGTTLEANEIVTVYLLKYLGILLRKVFFYYYSKIDFVFLLRLKSPMWLQLFMFILYYGVVQGDLAQKKPPKKLTFFLIQCWMIMSLNQFY